MSSAPAVTRAGPLGLLWLRRIFRRGAERYLDRWSLRHQAPDAGGGGRVYLHRFWAPDAADEGLHNHPWEWSFSIVLWGSYTELYADVDARTGELGHLRARRVRFFNWISARRYHRIAFLHPRAGRVWTLFVCGPLSGDGWGYWLPGRGHVPFRQRHAERELEAAALAAHRPGEERAQA